jgi:hypothetical protein
MHGWSTVDPSLPAITKPYAYAIKHRPSQDWVSALIRLQKTSIWTLPLAAPQVPPIMQLSVVRSGSAFIYHTNLDTDPATYQGIILAWRLDHWSPRGTGFYTVPLLPYDVPRAFPFEPDPFIAIVIPQPISGASHIGIGMSTLVA